VDGKSHRDTQSVGLTPLAIRDGDQKSWAGGFCGTVLGDTWFCHHGHHNHQSTRGLIAPGARKSPLTRGLSDGDIWGPTDVYAVRLPLPGDTVPVILGRSMDRKGLYLENDAFLGMRPTDDVVAGVGHNPTADRGQDRYNPNDPPPPVAWTESYQLPNGPKGKGLRHHDGLRDGSGVRRHASDAGQRRLLVGWLGEEDSNPRDQGGSRRGLQPERLPIS